jgi:hypothetical protein
MAFVNMENKVCSAEMLIHMMFTHVVCGVGVEVAGTEHVATASFDVAGCHIKVGI